MVKDEQVQEKMFACIRSWQQSDMSQKQWCHQQNISYHIFHYWYRKFKDEQQTKEDSGSFVRLTPSTIPSSGCEVVFTDGTRIIFHESVAVQYLKTLLF